MIMYNMSGWMDLQIEGASITNLGTYILGEYDSFESLIDLDNDSISFSMNGAVIISSFQMTHPERDIRSLSFSTVEEIAPPAFAVDNVRWEIVPEPATNLLLGLGGASLAFKHLGLGKNEKKAEALGLRKPSPEVVRSRLETLRTHRWSSYREYAGYEKAVNWLKADEVLSRVKGGREGYRKLAEERMRQGRTENIWSQLRWGVVLGSERFAEEMRDMLKTGREVSARRELRKRVSWEDVVGAIEKTKRERWDAFVDRHGDWGRDLALWVGRRHTGLTLGELGARAGGMDYGAVAMSVKRMKLRLSHDKTLRDTERRLDELLFVKM
ncbi:MAG: hypothetical protein KJ726_04240 [Verrucomicrobia bacterium]|nr:hypothetical protein [Verrucomicrobiota bacterium]